MPKISVDFGSVPAPGWRNILEIDGNRIETSTEKTLTLEMPGRSVVTLMCRCDLDPAYASGPRQVNAERFQSSVEHIAQPEPEPERVQSGLVGEAVAPPARPSQFSVLGNRPRPTCGLHGERLRDHEELPLLDGSEEEETPDPIEEEEVDKPDNPPARERPKLNLAQYPDEDLLRLAERKGVTLTDPKNRTRVVEQLVEAQIGYSNNN